MARQKRGQERGRRCAVEGCGRAARRGAATCPDHARTAEGKALTRATRQAAADALAAVGEGAQGALGALGAQDDEERRRRAAERFRRRVSGGSYRGLFDGAVRRILDEGAREGRLTEELGALRYALARLLAEEGEAWRLAREVARLAVAATTVEKARAALGWDQSGELVDVLSTILARVGEEDERRAREADEARRARQAQEETEAVGWQKYSALAAGDDGDGGGDEWG